MLAAQVSDQPIDGACSLACCHDAHPKPTDFQIRVSPLQLGGDRVYVFVFHDVTATKRRELLERMFLHDLGNLATGLIGWSEELSEFPASDAAERVLELAHRLSEQLDEQRQLIDFERGNTKLRLEVVDVDALTSQLKTWFGAHDCAKHRHLSVDLGQARGTLRTDKQLLLRILVNLLKNAFEATPSGGTVALRISNGVERWSFEVHNAGWMPKSSSVNIFKRRFSTKGPARGLGTHAVQFFGEQCLGGQVSFVSEETTGTTFRFELPATA